MRNFTPFQSWSCWIFTVLVTCYVCEAYQFLCKDYADQGKIPTLPNAYTTNIRVNYLQQEKTVEVREAADLETHKFAMEFWAWKRHVKYIVHDDQLLFISYEDNGPTCAVSKLDHDIGFLENEDAGPYEILEKLRDTYHQQASKFSRVHQDFVDSAIVMRWELCSIKPSINVTLTFTAKNWNNSRTSVLHDGEYPFSAEAQIHDNFTTASFYNFDPKVPSAKEFQPPENVYCKGFRENISMPVMPKFFSYDSEIIQYSNPDGIDPVTNRRTMYYDFSLGLARSDLYDADAEDDDLFSRVTAQDKTLIHDFNSGIEYNIDPNTGECNVDDFQVTVGPIDIKEDSVHIKMPNVSEFFSLNSVKTSYNGKYETRGYEANVFTALVEKHEGASKKKYIYSWYFSSDAQIVEGNDVDENVLLRMVVRPEAADGKEDETVVNFYNFMKSEPSIFTYDFTSCYSNASLSKTFVLTFPAKEELRGKEKLLRNQVHQGIHSAINLGKTKVSKQRIFVTEVVFSADYMHAEFKILAAPDERKKEVKTSETSLAGAVAQLKESISKDILKVWVPTKEKHLVISPESNGLNEFAGDRISQLLSSYSEAGVICLSIGMLILGIFLGGITINLAISRKYGVSLFQFSNKRRGDPFSNSFNESSI